MQISLIRRFTLKTIVSDPITLFTVIIFNSKIVFSYFSRIPKTPPDTTSKKMTPILNHPLFNIFNIQVNY